jgi:hypothetical protein
LSRHRNPMLLGIILSFVFVVVGAVWLSQSQETLDKVAEHLGATVSPIWNPPIPDYEIPGFEGNPLMNIVIGTVFTLLVLAVAFIVGKSLKAKAKIQD